MSKNWYPIINYDNCIECGSCIKKCSYGVYDKAKAPTPVVVFPEGCVQGCHGCGNLCPAEAITYYGDNGKGKPSVCGCSRDNDNGGCCG